MQSVEILEGDALEILRTMPEESIQACITSPPYFNLRDYGVDGQIGNEKTPQEYIERLVLVFHEVRRVLKANGTLWLNIGDSYAGSRKGRKADGTSCAYGKQATNAGSVEGIIKPSSKVWDGIKPKDLIGIPWMLAFALRDDGWYLRQDIIWHKPNPMPESVTDRCVKSHEYMFLLSKSKKYYFDYKAIQEETNPKYARRYASGFFNQKEQMNFMPDGRHNTAGLKNYTGKRNKRDVWRVASHGSSIPHFATFPEKLIEPCIIAATQKGDTVLDPFSGSGTTGVVAIKHGRNYVGIELNPKYVDISNRRFEKIQGDQMWLEGW